MKRLFILWLFLLFAKMGIGQDSVRGYVFDEESREPMYGVTIYISELKTGTISNLDGSFEINNLPRRTFLAEFSTVGYAKKVVKFNPADSSRLNIYLSTTAVEIQEVVVTGVASATERAKNPVSVVPVKKDIYLQNTSFNLIDGLTKLPGVDQISTGTGISKPVIRGLGYNRVIVLRNGIRQEGQQWGDEHGIELDGNEVEKVEIIKGPGSLMYGSDAMAGVINFLLPHPVAMGKLSGEVQSEYQTNANLLSTSVMQAGNVKGLTWQGRFSTKKAGNFSNPADGKVLNSGLEEYAGSGYIGLNRNWGHSQFHFSTFNQQLGIPEGERDSSGLFIGLIASNGTEKEITYNDGDLSGYQNSINLPFQRVNHHRIAWSNVIFSGGSKITTDIGWQQNRRREFADVLNPSETELEFRLNTFNANLKYDWPEHGNWNLATGLSFQYQQSENFGVEYLIPAYQATDGGAFVFAQKEKNKWFFSGGLRADFRHLKSEALYLNEDEEPVPPDTGGSEEKFAAFNRDFTNWTGSIGASYQISKPLVARLNLSRGFRAPNLAELGSNGKHEGTFRYEVGNHRLKAETSLQWDAGLTYTGGHVTFDISGFYNGIQHFIFLEKLKNVMGSDSIIDVEDGSPVFRFVQGNALLFGGEISMDIHPHPFDFLHFENSISYVRGQRRNQPDSLENLPFVPAPKFQSQLRAHFDGPLRAMKNTYLKVEGDYFFEQNRAFTTFGTETPTPGYFLLSAGFGTDILNDKKTVIFRVFITASNLLDKKYVSHLSRLKYAPENPATGSVGIYNPGRNFSVKVIVPLIFVEPM